MVNMMNESNNPITVRGILTNEGVECQAMRSLNDNKLYTLTGNLQGFKTGDKVEVTGKVN